MNRYMVLRGKSAEPFPPELHATHLGMNRRAIAEKNARIETIDAERDRLIREIKTLRSANATHEEQGR